MLKFLSGKAFKTFNPPDFKFYPSKLTDKKNSPYGVMLNFLCFFCIVKCNENRHKINIAPYGENFIFYITYRDKCKGLHF